MSVASKKSYLVAIGGLDPSGHAGLLADAKVFHRLNISFCAVATAVTAQSEKKFISWKPVELKLFRQQLAAVEGNIFGVKIGMLASYAHLTTLVNWLKNTKPKIILWDPVLRSSTGYPLLHLKSSQINKLFEIADLITPNLPEAEWILKRKFKNSADIKLAIRRLFAMGIKSKRMIILKGGHSKEKKSPAVDLIFDGRSVIELSAPRRPFDRRGTGCSFGAALLAGIYLGKERVQATRFAKKYVLTHILNAPTP